MLVRNGENAHAIAQLILSPPGGVAMETRYVGRAGLHSVLLSNGGSGLVRSYQHGGIFRHWSRDWFFTWPPRPFVELAITEQARHRGVPTLDVVAALVAYAWGPLYRGWLVTRELHDAEDLWGVVRNSDSPQANARLMQQVGKTVRSMHDAGVYHADLNMRNLLVCSPSQDLCVIDFDKGRVFERRVPLSLRRRNVARLLRSIKKLDPARRFVSEEDWRNFLVAYDD